MGGAWKDGGSLTFTIGVISWSKSCGGWAGNNSSCCISERYGGGTTHRLFIIIRNNSRCSVCL